MHVYKLAFVTGLGALVAGCAEQASETQETIENLVQAGFVTDDILVVNGVVYAGRDAEVSLEASREMLQVGESSKEQYRTTNTVSLFLTKLCINGSTLSGVFSTALDLAIQNYDELPLTFAMARTPSSGCNFTLNAVMQPGVVDGSSGFPVGGKPFRTINIGDGLSMSSVDSFGGALGLIQFRRRRRSTRQVRGGGIVIHSVAPSGSHVGCNPFVWIPACGSDGFSGSAPNGLRVAPWRVSGVDGGRRIRGRGARRERSVLGRSV